MSLIGSGSYGDTVSRYIQIPLVGCRVLVGKVQPNVAVFDESAFWLSGFQRRSPAAHVSENRVVAFHYVCVFSVQRLPKWIGTGGSIVGLYPNVLERHSARARRDAFVTALHVRDVSVGEVETTMAVDARIVSDPHQSLNGYVSVEAKGGDPMPVALRIDVAKHDVRTPSLYLNPISGVADLCLVEGDTV